MGGSSVEERVQRLDRRTLLGRMVRAGALVWAGGAGLALGCSRAEPACYDPELLSTAERAARRSRGYVDVSPEGEAKRCGVCAFFEPGEAVGCGQCAILGGPVSARGLCQAWSART